MSIAVMLLVIFFFFTVSDSGIEETIGQTDTDPQNRKTESWKKGEKKAYIDRVLNIYDTLAKYQKMDVEREEIAEELTQSYEEWEKGDRRQPYEDRLELTYHIRYSKAARKYEKQLEAGDDCYDYSAEETEFSYETDGNLLLIYCDKHQKLSKILPYRLSESDFSRELEKAGLEGLCDWMRETECNYEETVETRSGKKIKVAYPDSDQAFQHISVGYHDGEMTFDFCRSYAIEWEYLDDMMNSVEEMGWKISDVMAESCEKGIRCYPADRDQEKLYEERGMLIKAELIADRSKVKQLILYLPVYDARKEGRLITSSEQSIKDMMIYAGMDSGKAQELIDELTCISKTEKGVKGGYAWNLTKLNDYTYYEGTSEEGTECSEYLLVLSKVK